MSKAESKDQKFKTLEKEQQVKIFEDDDEFEEFPADTWGPADEAGDATNKNAWQENWDDDDVEDDFSQKLKQILKSKGHVQNWSGWSAKKCISGGNIKSWKKDKKNKKH